MVAKGNSFFTPLWFSCRDGEQFFAFSLARFKIRGLYLNDVMDEKEEGACELNKHDKL